MTTIHIETLNVHVNLGAAQQGIPTVLAAILSSLPSMDLGEEQGDTASEGAAEVNAGIVNGEAAAPAAEAGPQVTQFTAADVLAWLRSDERYTSRSLDAAVQQFGDDAALTLNELVDTGKVITKRRRSDGATLYQAAPEAEAAAPVAPAEAVTPEAIAQFIDDSDHSLRSREAIAKHFENVSAEDLDRALEEGVNDETLFTRTRRRDRATLYGSNL